MSKRKCGGKGKNSSGGSIENKGGFQQRVCEKPGERGGPRVNYKKKEGEGWKRGRGREDLIARNAFRKCQRFENKGGGD